MAAAMIVDPAGRQVLGGGGAIPVDVRSLAAELRRLWLASRSAPLEPRGREGAPDSPPTIARACTRNLVVLTGAADQAGRASQLIGAIADRHPVRSFVVHPSADFPPGLVEANLSAHCVVRGETRQVCCEQVSLAVAPDARRRAAAAIVPLFLPDLPVFV